MTPHHPNTRKGRIRATMEANYAQAARSGQRTIILRWGEFIAPKSPRSFWNTMVLKPLAKGRITSLCDPTVRRAYAYLPDMARAAVALADIQSSLPVFADVPILFDLPHSLAP